MIASNSPSGWINHFPTVIQNGQAHLLGLLVEQYSCSLAAYLVLLHLALLSEGVLTYASCPGCLYFSCVMFRLLPLLDLYTLSLHLCFIEPPFGLRFLMSYLAMLLNA